MADDIINIEIEETTIQVVEVRVDPSAAQTAVDAALDAQNTLEEIQDLIEDFNPDSDPDKEDKVSGVIAYGIDNYTVTVPEVTELVEGYKILCLFENSNTGAATINVNELGVKQIRKELDVQLISDDLIGSHWLIYDGEHFQIVGHVPEQFPLSLDEILAIKEANSPSAANPVATMDDLEGLGGGGTSYEYLRQVFANMNLANINTWYSWNINSSNILVNTPNQSLGTGAQPARTGVYADTNVMVLRDVKKLTGITFHSRLNQAVYTMQIFVIVADYVNGRGYEPNEQIVVNHTFTFTSNQSCMQDLNILSHADFNPNSVMHVFARLTSGANNLLGVQMLYKFEKY